MTSSTKPWSTAEETREALAANSLLTLLTRRLESKTAKIGVIGMGYVGLPLATHFARKGFHTTGFDVDTEKIETLWRGQSYIKHIPGKSVAAQIARKLFVPCSDFSTLGDMDAILICVPTPLDSHREPDLSYVEAAAEEIGKHLRHGQLIVLESTTYPGTTDELLISILEKSGLHCQVAPYTLEGSHVNSNEGQEPDFFVAFSPEREDPGNKRFRSEEVPKVVGGVNASSALAAQALYQCAFAETVLVSSSRTAEMTKLLENIYRCVNIALVNELKLVSAKMGIDIWEVIAAAKTKPYGFTPFYPGPGLGGHCIPVDPFYLTWKAREFDLPTRFIELAGETNAAMPAHVVNGVAAALDRHHKTLIGSNVLVLGVAYKKDIDDVRESPALKIIDLLTARGAVVSYHDPYVPHLGRTKERICELESTSLTTQELNMADCTLIVTDHSAFDYEQIVRESSLVVDTRNATAGLTYQGGKIVRC